MDTHEQDRPCIHVVLTPGANTELYRWVEIGAEEEGVPCRRVSLEGANVVALAYAAAQSSRLSIGVGIDTQNVVLHETHMPEQQPVLAFHFAQQAPYFCRLMGSNAARMVVRRPLRFGDEPPRAQQKPPRQAPPAPPIGSPEPVLELEPEQLKALIIAIVRKVQERGLNDEKSIGID